ncbi:antirestriction protein [Xenorhabdus bovienii]|nr:antirestriction protein [Xenorhabdus bovienii]
MLTRIARPDESNNEAFRFSSLREYALSHPEASSLMLSAHDAVNPFLKRLTGEPKTPSQSRADVFFL